VKIEWSPAARASARRYMADQDGMRAIGAAISQLADDPYSPGAFHRGDYHRLRAGPYRVVYVVEDDLITIERVDRITDARQ
jgi:mRNA-degrading endonuclease RelE of RelBE toxin-antitoxin system